MSKSMTTARILATLGLGLAVSCSSPTREPELNPAGPSPTLPEKEDHPARAAGTTSRGEQNTGTATAAQGH